jgi:hypothetical protein
VVPELTRSAGIQLNKRVSLQRQRTELSFFTGQFPQTSGPTRSKPSRDHTPLGGFVRGRAPDQPVLPMAASEKEPKRVLTLSELAEQFRELERLREKVRALEQSASDRTAFGRTGRTAQSDAK